MNNRINNKANEAATSQLLIELIKGMELIYNNNHPDYKNAAKRGKVWKSITNVMNESFRCGWDETKCRRRWRTLRDHFVKHLRQNGTEKGYKFFTQMAFLLPIYADPNIESIVISEDETVCSSTNTADDDISQVQLIKSDSSESIHIDDTEYIEHSEVQVNGATTSNSMNYSLPIIVMPSAHEMSAQNVNNANRPFDQIVVSNPRTMTPPTASPANNASLNRNHAQNGDSAMAEMDEHDVFGELVIREMRKMTPEAKKAFKRNVTQLLYS